MQFIPISQRTRPVRQLASVAVLTTPHSRVTVLPAWEQLYRVGALYILSLPEENKL